MVQEALLIIRVSIDRTINFWCRIEWDIFNSKMSINKYNDKKRQDAWNVSDKYQSYINRKIKSIVIYIYTFGLVLVMEIEMNVKLNPLQSVSSL